MGVFNASAHHASQRKTSETEKDNIKQHMYSCVYIYIYTHTRIKYILSSPKIKSDHWEILILNKKLHEAKNQEAFD